MTTAPLLAGSFPTPLGPMVALLNEAGALARLDFCDGPVDLQSGRWRDQPVRPDPNAIRQVSEQISDYFAGHLREFKLSLAPVGNTFQQQVWQLLQQIPYGETRSYGELARQLDMTHGARAVGRANGLNPIAVVIPCHRVIGADGKLTGYAGGLHRKAALLELEAARGQASFLY
tara:strand:+ start:2010 stop:2531 length:522 start_codon:yes stop_codon:yes gene_type:complete